MTNNKTTEYLRGLLLCSFVILCSFNPVAGITTSANSDSSPSGATYNLTKLNVYQHNSVYRYQARCSLACTGSYQPGTLYITINIDRVASAFEAFGNFEASQSLDSNIWWITNTNWLHENNGRCEFDLQLEYEPRNPEPRGTCQMGWSMDTECLVSDTSGVVDGFQTCSDIAEYNPHSCYNQTFYSKCCHACSARAEVSSTDTIYCPYGDRDVYECYSIDQKDCYSKDYKCCGTCKEYEESIPNCRYGDRQPELCDQIIQPDCYNSTTERNCCYQCHDLADYEQPDCMYGDKSTSCYDIERNQCYTRRIEDSCCQTCADFSSDIIIGCKYGDKEECYDVTQDECLNDNSVQNDCCQTCHYLQEYDCVDDYGDYCFTEPPSACYNETLRRSCCRTCLSYYDVTLGENCLYGDRRPNLCYNITGQMCYNSDVALDCCLQCTYFELNHLPETCLYGNKASNCRDIVAWECYQPSMEDRCCETCHSYNLTDSRGYDCRYGDKIDSCYSRPINSCYDDNSRNTCCQFCSTMENENDPDCPYGDKLSWCTSTLTPSMCYDFEDECCQTCDYMIKHHLDQGTCKYGDRRNCTNISASDCYTTSVEYQCCETCFYLKNPNNNDCSFGDAANCTNLVPWQCYSRDVECCDTCQQYYRPNLVAEGCKYGDRAGYCANISPYECYDPDTAYTCCGTCYRYRRDDLPISCQYGDKSTQCQTGDAHGSYCYNVTVRDQCCESCLLIQTDDPLCLYGDKSTFCSYIEAHDCYQTNTESLCCDTCPAFYEDSYPEGCKYGDTKRNCRLSMCDNYSSGELTDCCYTCRSFLTTTPPSTIPTTADKSSGGDNTAEIVGGVVGGIVVIVIIVVVAFYCVRFRNRGPKSDYKRSSFDPMDAHRHNQLLATPGISAQSNANGHVSYNAGKYSKQPQKPPQRPPPKRQESTQDEVYDYINPDDVKSVISMPITRRPTLPERKEDNAYEPYLEPMTTGDNEKTEKTGYDNLGLQANDPRTYHQYYVLQKEPDQRL